MKLDKMTELQIQFQKEKNVSFTNIPINGVHLEYINWLEAQVQSLRKHDVVEQSENVDCEHEWWESSFRGGGKQCLKCKIIE